MITAGGHISSFHAAMKKMHETLEKNAPGRFNLVGANGGLEGLVKYGVIPIKYEDIEEDRAGSLIGCDRKVPEVGEIANALKKNQIYATIMMGGDDHLKDTAQLSKLGIKVVGYPKTMDGDLASGVTLGYESAVSFAAIQVRNHFNTAMTFERIFYIGLFGRNTDWVPCAVSLYGGADRCIPCEEEYEWDYVAEKIETSVKENQERYKRNGKGLKFAVVVYSEGAEIKAIDEPSEKHSSRDQRGHVRLQPEWVGLELVRLTKAKGYDACFQTYTYSLRDCPPTETDKKLSRMAGEECINMILQDDFGKCAVFLASGDFYITSRELLEKVAIQKKLKPEGYFDYKELKPTEKFVNDYSRLFKHSLGNCPNKDSLVYKNL